MNRYGTWHSLVLAWDWGSFDIGWFQGNDWDFFPLKVSINNPSTGRDSDA